MAMNNDIQKWLDGIDLDDNYSFQNEINPFDSINNNMTSSTACSKFQPNEEHILPQKLSQLNYTTTKIMSRTPKDMQNDLENIPDYLTKQSYSLQQMLHQALSSMTTLASNQYRNVQMESLRHIAILIYKTKITQSDHLLWTTYLKSGMGQLVSSSPTKLSYSTTIPVWPKQVKSLIQSSVNKKTYHEHDFYLKLVQDHLYALEQQIKQSQMELNMKTRHIRDYTVTAQKTIETYIEENLQSYRMETANQIELIHYDYHIRALKVEYLRHQINASQEYTMKTICRSKYEHEMAEQEYQLLKKQVAYYNTTGQSFDSSPLSHSLFTDSIHDTAVRQVIRKDFEETAEQSRTTLLNFYLKTAADQREEYRNKYEMNMNQMRSNQHSHGYTQKLSPFLIQLIHERCEKISERIKYVYQLKAASISSKFTWQN